MYAVRHSLCVRTLFPPLCLPAAGCPSSDFDCDNGNCVQASLECDGRDDCHDNSDEKYCSTGEPERASCTHIYVPPEEMNPLRPSTSFLTAAISISQRSESRLFQFLVFSFTQSISDLVFSPLPSLPPSLPLFLQQL